MWQKFQRIGNLLAPGKLIHTKPADVHTGGSAASTGLALKLLGAVLIKCGTRGIYFCTANKSALDQLEERLLSGWKTIR